MKKTKAGHKYYPRRKWKKPLEASNIEKYEAWGAIRIRSEYMTMLRELANYYRISTGQVAMFAIERDFREVFGKKEIPIPPFSPPSKAGRPRTEDLKILYVPDFSDLTQDEKADD